MKASSQRMAGVSLAGVVCLGLWLWSSQRGGPGGTSAGLKTAAQPEPGAPASADMGGTVRHPSDRTDRSDRLGPVEAFSSWADKYARASAAEKAAMLAEGAKLAAERRAEMRRLITTDPKA